MITGIPEVDGWEAVYCAESRGMMTTSRMETTSWPAIESFTKQFPTAVVTVGYRRIKA